MRFVVGEAGLFFVFLDIGMVVVDTHMEAVRQAISFPYVLIAL